jgi:hypothetical protein
LQIFQHKWITIPNRKIDLYRISNSDPIILHITR